MLLLLAPLKIAAGVVSFGFGIVTEVVGHNGSPLAHITIGRFGHSIGLSSDGNTLIAGMPWKDESRVYVYSGASTVWSQRGTPLSTGDVVAISSDGIRVAVSDTDSNNGQVSVYDWISDRWQQQGSSIIGAASGDPV